ncbi:MAG: response regulator transcription factor [Ruminococcaceae bacterium]|nr:response regulator transcription factor [Oscillospiraceae bacterium]
MNRILIVEDERPIADLIEMTLTQAGYQCDIALDGVAAADIIEENRHDLIILDIMLPGASGYELMDFIAGAAPVIFLTAMASVNDRVKGLRMGADDYIVKPFEPPELVARVETVLRRLGKGSAQLIAFGISVDTVARTVTRQEDNTEIALTPREFDLLEILLRNRGVALYREVLFERAWGGEPEGDTRTLDLHIQRLRKKLGWQGHIRTVYKIGYMLEKDT